MQKVVFSICIIIFLFISSALADTYPQFDISGYKKWQFYKISVNPQSNYFLAQTHLGGLSSYLGLSGPWQERLTLKISSKLSERLSLSYDIEQEPESPQKSNVKVKYDQTELSFGEFTANFSGNEFAQTTKYLNGVMLSSYDPAYSFIFVPSTKSKSENQQISSGRGNNTRGPYSLGHGSIVEGSESIILNNIPIKRGVDYSIDYFEGKITFSRILSPVDEFTYTYEFTNFIDLFFPTVSKRDFFGVQARKTFNKMFFEIGYSPSSILLSQEAHDKYESFSYVYKLKHLPIVDFSEKVSIGEKELKKFDDYLINYDEGTLFLLTYEKPSSLESLNIDYNYFETTYESESFFGKSGKGPYNLKYGSTVKSSENISVNGIRYFKDLDYLIDYQNGKITFNKKLSDADTISIKYKHIKAYAPPKEEPKNAFTFGGTYLKESAKKGAGSTTVTQIETKYGKNIENNLINLDHFPLDPSQKITIKVNGADFTNFYVPTEDAKSLKLPYINIADDSSNGYATGSIKINATLNATDEIVIIYSYKKSIIGKFTGYGNGGRGPYFITNIGNIVPASDRMQVWTSGSSLIETYARNGSIDATSGRYSINYNYPYTPYVMFNDPFPTDKNFTVTFYYVPQGVTIQEQDLTHDVLGFDSSIKLGDSFKFDTAVGKSRTDQIIIKESTKEAIKGKNSRGPYSLSNKNIIEGSEKIYIDGWLRNRDIDYFINYTNGEITFYYLIITPENIISAEYDYQSASGVPTGSQIRSGNAYKFEVATNAGPFNAGGYVKDIGSDFSPLGSTSLGIGSRREAFNFSYNPNKYFSIYSNMLETKNQIGSYRGFYLRNADRNFKISINPQKYFDLNMNYRNTKSLDDLTPGVFLHSSDSSSTALSGSLNFMPLETKHISFTNRNDFSKTESINNLNNNISSINYLHSGNSIDFLKRVSFNFDYQLSEPITSSSETVVAHDMSKDTSYDINWDMKFGLLNRFSSRLRSVSHEQKNLITSLASATRNESFSIYLDPFSNLSSSYEKNRDEALSVRTGQENPKTERNNFTIRFAPFSNASISLGKSEDESFQESGNKSRGNIRNTLVEYTPFQFLRIGSRFDLQDRISVVISGTSEITTNLNTETRNYTASITPFGLLTINSEFIVEDYNNKNNTGTINTKTQNITSRYNTSFSPMPRISISLNYSEKKTKDLLMGLEKPKDLFDVTTSWQISDFGSLVHTLNHERNLGEVQAGIVTNYDILKITNSYGINLTFPQSNSILSSIRFNASYKEVSYSDYLTPSNNFLANLLSFEGSLNF